VRLDSNEVHCQRSFTDCLLAKKNSAPRGVLKSESYGKRENFVLPREAAASVLSCHRFHASKRDVIRLHEDSGEQSAFLYHLELPKEIPSHLNLLPEIEETSSKHSPVAAVLLQNRIDGAFIKQTNFKLLAEGVAYACGLAITSKLGTVQNWARHIWIPSEAVSKVTKFRQWESGPPVELHMRNEEKCRAYSEAQKNGDTKKSTPPRWRGLEEIKIK